MRAPALGLQRPLFNEALRFRGVAAVPHGLFRVRTGAALGSGQRPVNTGGRFSRNARCASFASSVFAIAAVMSCS